MHHSDIIVAGAGIGGLTSAALLAQDGYTVTVLEAANVGGGSCSTFERNGMLYDSGATTLIGFDEGQPLHFLENKFGMELQKHRLTKPMTIHFPGGQLTRYENEQDWIMEAARFFGEPESQEKFWTKIFRLSRHSWDVAARLKAFPPANLKELLALPFAARIKDITLLPALTKSLGDFARECGINTEIFHRFLDAQLLITTQSRADETPLLFAAPALAYTNSGNFYLDGGMIKLVEYFENIIRKNTSNNIFYRHRVSEIRQNVKGNWEVQAKRKTFTAPVVISNLTVWNLAKILDSHKISQKLGPERYGAMGAFSVYFTAKDTFKDDIALHHQIHAPGIPHLCSESIFVSLSRRGDTSRAPEGFRTVNISSHTHPEFWYGGKNDMLKARGQTTTAILDVFCKHFVGVTPLPGHLHPATPFTWERWAFREKGRVGGIPQSMRRMLWDWPNANPARGLYLTGDTVFPGQGIPGVAMSGIMAWRRILSSGIV
jgi:C-3',4' desaturase CrtD